MIGDTLDLANIIPGSTIGILIIVIAILLIYKLIKIVIPLAIAVGIVLLLWKLGVFASILG